MNCGAFTAGTDRRGRVLAFAGATALAPAAAIIGLLAVAVGAAVRPEHLIAGPRR